MTLFHNVLVGVDLSRGDWMADATQLTPSRLACRRGVDVAKATGAKLHFLSALDLDARTQRILKEAPETEETVLTEARQALGRVADEAVAEGVSATFSIEPGRSWEQLIERARSEGHDLVIVGSRYPSRIGTLLLGSTGLHVVQSVKAPVWVARPRDGILNKIMIATDFSPVCDDLSVRAAELARIFEAELHIVHVLPPRPKGFWDFVKTASDSLEQDQVRVTQEAEKQLAELANRLEEGLPNPPQLHLLEGAVDEVILDLIAAHQIDLLAMGLVAWRGLQGFLMGSSAHALFPQLECSLLTMRGSTSS